MILLLLLLQSSMLTCDKISRAHELHKVCSSYPEPVLTAAFESLKRRGILSNVKLVNDIESNLSLLLCGLYLFNASLLARKLWCYIASGMGRFQPHSFIHSFIYKLCHLLWRSSGASSCLSPVATVMGSVGSVVSRCDLIVIITTQRQFNIYTVHCIMQHDPSSSCCYVIRPLSKGLTHQHCHRMYITFTQLVRPPLLFILFLSSSSPSFLHLFYILLMHLSIFCTPGPKPVVANPWAATRRSPPLLGSALPKGCVSITRPLPVRFLATDRFKGKFWWAVRPP